MNIVVPHGNGGFYCACQAFRVGALAESQLHRFATAAVMVSTKPSSLRVPTNKAAERPIGESDIWRYAVRRLNACAGTVMARKTSSACSALAFAPTTKSRTGIFRSIPSAVQIVQMPSSADSNAAIGPAAKARHRLPPTVATDRTLNDPSKARQHCANKGAAMQSGGKENASRSANVQVAPISSPSVSYRRFCQPLRQDRRGATGQFWGSEKSQVPPARRASPGCQHGNDRRSLGVKHGCYCVEIHAKLGFEQSFETKSGDHMDFA